MSAGGGENATERRDRWQAFNAAADELPPPVEEPAVGMLVGGVALAVVFEGLGA